LPESPGGRRGIGKFLGGGRLLGRRNWGGGPPRGDSSAQGSEEADGFSGLLLVEGDEVGLCQLDLLVVHIIMGRFLLARPVRFERGRRVFQFRPISSGISVPTFKQLGKDVKNQAVSAPVLVDVRDMTVRADVARLDDVYEQHGARLWRAVFLYAGDREVASDAVAEAFAQALRRGNELRSPERWVWRSAFRIAAGELSRRTHEARGLMDAAYETPTETAELLVALPRLTPKQRVAIVLHYHAGYSLKEVAQIIGSTPSAVGVHIHRGRKRLRELLGDDDD